MSNKSSATSRPRNVVSAALPPQEPHLQGGVSSVSGSRSNAVDIAPDVKDDLHKRLRRIEGQVRGIQAMLGEDRECRDIVTQIAAATRALEQVGFRMLASGLASCLQDPVKAARDGYAVEEVEKMFLKLS